MSEETYEMRCPACSSVVPAHASSCPTCAGKKSRRPELATAAVTAEPVAPDIAVMKMKDYHRFVRANYRSVEGPRAAGAPGAGAVRYLPFAILLLGLLVAAIVLHPF